MAHACVPCGGLSRAVTFWLKPVPQQVWSPPAPCAIRFSRPPCPWVFFRGDTIFEAVPAELPGSWPLAIQPANRIRPCAASMNSPSLVTRTGHPGVTGWALPIASLFFSTQRSGFYPAEDLSRPGRSGAWGIRTGRRGQAVRIEKAPLSARVPRVPPKIPVPGPDNGKQSV